MIKFACGSLLFLGDAAAAAYSASDSHAAVFLAALGSVAMMVPEVVRWVDHFLNGGPAEA